MNTTLTRRGDRGRDPGPARELLDGDAHRARTRRQQQRPGRRPADRARHGRQPGGRVRSSGTSRRCPRRRRRTSMLSAPLAKDHAAGTATNLNNVILTTPLTKAHATGVAVADPQPLITAAKATELQRAARRRQDQGRRGRHRGRDRRAAGVRHGRRGHAAAVVSAGCGADRPAAAARTSTRPAPASTVGAAEPGVQAIRVVLQPDRRSVAIPERDLQDPRQRPRRWLPPPVDRRLRVR